MIKLVESTDERCKAIRMAIGEVDYNLHHIEVLRAMLDEGNKPV